MRLWLRRDGRLRLRWRAGDGRCCHTEFLQSCEALLEGVHSAGQFLRILPTKRLAQTAHTNESNDAEDRPHQEKQDQEDDERCFHEQGVWQGLDHSQLPDTTGLALAKMGQIR